jgi:argininosuccinate synthase
MKRIVLAASGSPDLAAAIEALRAKHRAEIITLTVDLGGEFLQHVQDAALTAGARRAHVLDGRERFASEFILPGLKAEALAARVPCFDALAATYVASQLVEIARLEGAHHVAHGAPRNSRTHRRIERAVRAIDPRLDVIPRSWPLAGGRGADGSSVRSAAPRPQPRAVVAVTFDRGVPVEVNGVPMSLPDLIDSVSTIAAAHGIGAGQSTDAARRSGPSALVVLQAAHHEILRQRSSPELERFFHQASDRYADVIATGNWFTPMRRALDAFVDAVHEDLTGVATVSIANGVCEVVNDEVPASTGDRGRHADDPVGIPAGASAAAARDSFVVVR